MELSYERKTAVRNRFEKGLYIAVLLLAGFYLQLSVYRNVIDIYYYYLGIAILKRGLLIAAAAFVAEFVVLKLRSPEQWNRKKRQIHKMCSYEQLFLVFLFFWFLATCALRQLTVGGNYFKGNSFTLFLTFLIAFLFFPLAQYCGRESVKQSMDGLMISLVIPATVFAAWILWHYFRAEYVMLPSGRQLEMEAPAILRFTGENHNAPARTAMVMFGLSVILLFTRKPRAKAIYLPCAFVFAVYLVLTNSRTTWFAALLFVAGTTFLAGWNRFERKKLAARLGICIGLAVFAGILWFLLQKGIFALLRQSLARFLMTTVNETAAAAGSAAGVGEIQARSYSSNIGTVGNRLPLYQASIAAMFSSPYHFFFGVTPADVIDTLRATGVSGVSQTFEYAHAHNLFFQIGLSFGVPTMIGMIVFSVSLVIRALRTMFPNRKKVFSGAGVIALFVCCMLANDMLEAILAPRPEFFSAMFYVLAGWLVATDKDVNA